MNCGEKADGGVYNQTENRYPESQIKFREFIPVSFLVASIIPISELSFVVGAVFQGNVCNLIGFCSRAITTT